MEAWIGRAREIRSQVTEVGNLQSAIDFQNDVNALVAWVAALDAPGSRLPSAVEAGYGILPLRAFTMKRLRRARERLRAWLAPKTDAPLRTTP